MCLALPISADDAQVDQPQQKSLETLLSDIQERRTTRSAEQNVSPEEQVRRLQNQLIDIRVERDLLAEENNFLRRQVDDMQNERSAVTNCPPGECITLAEAEEQQLLQHVIYSLSMYRLGEFMHSVIPAEDVEAHTRAQRLMDGAKEDLELLGFDTSNPDDFPTLEELLEGFEIAHERAHSRISAN